MKVLPIERGRDRIAEHRRLVIRQQEITAELYRTGQKQRAREARSKLYALLNQLDLMQELGVASQSRGNAA